MEVSPLLSSMHWAACGTTQEAPAAQLTAVVSARREQAALRPEQGVYMHLT